MRWCGDERPLAVCRLLTVVATLLALVVGDCEFPKSWSGRWFQSGVRHLIQINTTSIETKGVCVESHGEKFIMEEKTAGEGSCFRCIFIAENHVNVLQYKETYCSDDLDSLDSLCNLISGDAALYLLFRDRPLSGPEPCPFKGAPFTFTYSRGSGDCRVPVSRIDSCIQESRLRIQYQACPDIPGTESGVEQLVCMAEWKEGSRRYLIAEINRDKRTVSDEDRYRCFLYEQTQRDGKVVYNVAQSGDATCNGLESPLEGSRTMKLTRVDTEHTRCRYPKWVTDHHTWHSLDHTTSYRFSQRNHTLRVLRDDSPFDETRVVCHGVESNGESEVRMVAHTTRECHSGYVCMVFYRRDSHVIELQHSNVTVQVAEEACSPSVFDQNNVPFKTLVTANLRPHMCPHLGRYTLRSSTALDLPDPDCDAGAARYSQLTVGCSGHQDDTMQFHAACLTKPDAYSCHAAWELNGTGYVIASPVSRNSNAARRHCFVYSTSSAAHAGSGKVAPATLTSYTDACHRTLVGARGTFSFNLTRSGQCEEATTGAVSATSIAVPSVLFVLLLGGALAHAR